LIALIVNGVNRQFEEALSCQQLLERLDLMGKRIALERNGEIVPRSRHGAEMLCDGDKLEIVVAVGGG
jgi:sulfur carrier protein